MELPDLVRGELGDEEVQAAVSLGDEDAACFTATRTLVYRGEGLLSDEDVSAYPHDFERLAVSEGRRKTTFSMTYVDRQAEFTVPGDRADAVLERLLEGGLRVSDAVGSTESVEGVFRFSELTVVVAQHRLIKHVGEYTWDGDYEMYPFDDVSALHFEDGSVATAVVLEAGGRPERIKAPNEQAPLVRQTLERALFAHHDVDSLDELNATLAENDDDSPGNAGDQTPAGARSGGLDLDSGIDPLVSDEGDEGGPDRERGEGNRNGDRTEGDPDDWDGEPGKGGESDRTEAETGNRNEGDDGGATGTRPPDPTEPDADRSGVTAADRDTRSVDGDDGRPATREDMETVVSQLTELTEAVERQNELLASQQQTVEKLIEELRQGR